MQNTPQSWGRVYWGGGAGKPGEMGGWRFHCNFCNEGNLRTAFARKHLADNQLAGHCIEKHRHKTEVRALIQHEPMHDGPDTHAAWKITTGAAPGDGLIDGREVAGIERPGQPCAVCEAVARTSSFTGVAVEEDVETDLVEFSGFSLEKLLEADSDGALDRILKRLKEDKDESISPFGSYIPEN
jgi:hypothetical protein